VPPNGRRPSRAHRVGERPVRRRNEGALARRRRTVSKVDLLLISCNPNQFPVFGPESPRLSLRAEPGWSTSRTSILRLTPLSPCRSAHSPHRPRCPIAEVPDNVHQLFSEHSIVVIRHSRYWRLEHRHCSTPNAPGPGVEGDLAAPVETLDNRLQVLDHGSASATVPAVNSCKANRKQSAATDRDLAQTATFGATRRRFDPGPANCDLVHDDPASAFQHPQAANLGSSGIDVGDRREPLRQEPLRETPGECRQGW